MVREAVDPSIMHNENENKVILNNAIRQQGRNTASFSQFCVGRIVEGKCVIKIRLKPNAMLQIMGVAIGP